MKPAEGRHSSTSPVEGVILRRSRVIEVVLGAVVLAMGINLLATRVASASPSAALWGGLALVALPGVYGVARYLTSLGKSEFIDGVFFYAEDRDRFIAVPRYEYSEDVCRYLRAAFEENTALARSWKSQPLKDVHEPGGGPRSIKFVRQATEYWVINELSLHLSGHFETPGFGEDPRLVRLSRADIPDVLLDNAFLKLFSEPMEDRPAFADENDPDEESLGQIVSASGDRGEIFEFFELVLPKGSRVSRHGPHGVEIETDRFCFRITVDFNGTNTYVPFDFIEHYLREDPTDVSPFLVTLGTQSDLKFRAWLSPRGWEYYRWLDSFAERLRQGFSWDAYLSQIGWNSALTVAALDPTTAVARRLTATKRYLEGNSSGTRTDTGV